MEQKQKSESFKKLLDRLQEDSWQLELLVSAFVIFGLFYALDAVSTQLYEALFDKNTIYVNFFIVVRYALQIFIFNLILHVLLRALWIGSLGLRYVFGDIDFDKLNYSEKFTKYLKKNVGSFDTYISRLENICSVIFALTFLLVFYVFSFFIIVFVLIAFQTEIPDWMVFIVRVLFVLFSIGVLLTFFDLLTQGLLKKNKWVSKLYFPFYWCFSILTLSFLYRPIVYNLLDNKLGRRISFAIIPLYMVIYIILNLEYQKSNFLSQDIVKQANGSLVNGRNYIDVIEKKDKILMGEFAIQSNVINDNYIRILIPLNADIEDDLIEFNAKLKPENDIRGLKIQADITVETGKKSIVNFNDEYLRTFEKKYSFKIDTTTYKPEFILNISEIGAVFETFIGIKDLSEGKHIIEFQCLKNKDSDSLVSIRKVPFWYFKK